MNPALVIPTYWAQDKNALKLEGMGVYDHATALAEPVSELERCLSSLEQVRGVLRIFVLLVCEAEIEEAVRARVNGICRMHAGLNICVVGSAEAKFVQAAVQELAPHLGVDMVSLRGYGAIRNMGLAVSAIFGHDVVVFLDDDEIVLDGDFLLNAVYGLGLMTRQGLPIVAKSGYYLNQEASPYAPVHKLKLRNKYWSKWIEFNQWMHRAQNAPRISRSNYVCGGCFALSAEAFSKVAFDPIITRGEDLDYLLNLRLKGMDVWFDNQWCVRHLPPPLPDTAARFLQDVYRWEYEQAKLEAANNSIGLSQVRTESLRPYPSEWLSPKLDKRIRYTALIRAILGPERKAYLTIWRSSRKQAKAFAAANRKRYLQLATYWPRIIASMWDNDLLAQKILATGQIEDQS